VQESDIAAIRGQLEADDRGQDDPESKLPKVRLGGNRNIP